MSDEHWSAVYDSARAVRVNALRPFGFTERQTRFLVTVMAHDARSGSGTRLGPSRTRLLRQPRGACM